SWPHRLDAGESGHSLGGHAATRPKLGVGIDVVAQFYHSAVQVGDKTVDFFGLQQVGVAFVRVKAEKLHMSGGGDAFRQGEAGVEVTKSLPTQAAVGGEHHREAKPCRSDQFVERFKM